MFLGDYIHTLDDKGRVVMPAQFRAAIKEDGGEVVVTKGSEGNLVVFVASRFRDIAEEEMEQPRLRHARLDARAKFGSADLQKMDSQGRVMLKQKLRDYAGLTDATEVVVAGIYNYIEIWGVEAWEREVARVDAAFRESEEVPGF